MNNQLTVRQRQTLARTPARRRNQLRAQFLSQNRALPPVISYGIPRPRPRAQMGRNNNPNNGVNQRTVPPVTLTGSTIFHGIKITTKDQIDVLEITPSNIPALAGYAALFHEYRFNNISFSYSPGVSNTVAGLVAIGYISHDSTEPTDWDSAVKSPSLRVVGAHVATDRIQPPNYMLGTWLRNTTGVLTFGKLIAGFTGSFTGSLGAININYSCSFQGPKQ